MQTREKLLSRLALPLCVLPALLLAVAAPGSQKLILIGGGTLPSQATEKFAEWAGGAEAQLLVVSWSSQTKEPNSARDDGKETFQRLSQELRKSPVKSVDHAPSFEDMMSTNPAVRAKARETFLSQLGKASGVFFTGGDQGIAMQVLRDEKLRAAIRKKYSSGTVFAGTSAGTALMSERMFDGNGGNTVPGLGILPKWVLVDQHFDARVSRRGRLTRALKETGAPETVGLGVYEASALLVESSPDSEDLKLTTLISKDVKKVDEPGFELFAWRSLADEVGAYVDVLSRPLGEGVYRVQPNGAFGRWNGVPVSTREIQSLPYQPEGANRRPPARSH